MEASNKTPKSPKEAARDRMRFALAIALSALVLLGAPMILKRYFPSAPRPAPVTQPEERTAEQPPAKPAPPQTTPNPKTPASAAASQNATQPVATNAAPRDVIVQTRFWTVKLSNRGAVATSWVLRKIRRGSGAIEDIYAADGGPLELVSQKSIEPLGAPLRLRTPWSPELAALLNQSYFEVQGADSASGPVNIEESAAPRTITFTYSSGDVVARKSYTFYGDRFIFDANVEVKRGGETQPVQLAFGPHFGDQTDHQKGSYATPPQGVACTVNNEIDRITGAHITPDFAKVMSTDPGSKTIEIDKPLAADVHEVRIDDADGVLLGFARVRESDPTRLRLTLDEIPGNTREGCRVAQGIDVLRKSYRWAGLTDRYFGVVAMPLQPIHEVALSNAKLKLSAAEDPRDHPSLAVLLEPGSTTPIFVGPKDRDLLAQVSREMNENLDVLIDYGMFSFVVRPLIPIIAAALDWSKERFNNAGWGIVLVTVVINILLSPLRFYSSKKMKRASKHQPRFKELQERLKKLKENPKKNEREIEQLQREQVDLMREANPLPGCLPLILQMPIFWAFFVYLTISLDVRHAPWVLWIRDLSTPDPYYVLPIVMCVTMIGSTMLQPMPPSTDPSQKMQRVMMTWLMPIFLTWFFFISAPSGLVLYWMVSNVMGVVIQLVINRLTAEPPTEGAAAKEDSTKSEPGKKKPRGGGVPRKRSSEA